jgi:O-antigen ligase
MPPIYARLAFVLAMIAPVVALSTPVGSPAVFYVFVLLSLVALAHNAVHRFPPVSKEDFFPLALALCLPLLSILITNVLLPAWSNSQLEKNLRLALALPVFWLLVRTPVSWLRQVQWALIFAALYGSAVLIYAVYEAPLGRMSVSDYGAQYNAVTFANLTFMFGLGCLFTLGWRLSAWPRLEAGLKILAAAASFVGTVFSETRSSWMILPMFALIVLFSGRRWSSRTRLFCVLGAVALMAVAAFVAWKFNPRSSQVLVEVNEFFHGGNKDTSIGNRLQLWQASWIMFREHPWLGIGARNFRVALHVLMEKGVVTPLLVTGYGEPHDDFIAALADYGILGFGAILALYFIPAVVFFRKLKSGHRDVVVAAQLGLLLCLGYAVFSLTEMMFRNMRSVPIYSLTLVTFLALTRVSSPRSADNASIV